MGQQGGWGSGGMPPGGWGFGGGSGGTPPGSDGGGSGGGSGGGTPPGFGGGGGGAPGGGWGAPAGGGAGPAGGGSPPGFGGYGPPPGAPPGDPMGSGSWAPGEAATFAWERIKADPGTILGALIVAMLISNTVSFVGNGVEQVDPDSLGLQAVSLGLGLVNFVISCFMQGGMTLFALKVARGERYDFGDIFQGGPYFVTILAANILMGLGVGFGMLLLIVPGVILALGWSLTLPVAVDRKLGPIEAMKQSWSLTTGHKGNIFIFGLLMFALGLVGLIACCVGIFVVMAIGQIAWAYIYLRISGQQTA